MKSRRIISLLLAALLVFSAFSIAASAYDADIAESGYYNQTYLEDSYAAAAVGEKNLGCTYTPDATMFKVWAPQATGVSVKLYTTGTDAESGAAVLGAEEMNYNSSSGVWSLTLNGDYKNIYYTYVVDRDGVISETQDPYATAVGANGNRSMICDLDSTDPDGWDTDDHVYFDNPGEAVIWEVHVRDFSIEASSGVSEANRGKYLAFTEGNTTVNGEGKVASCVDYLVEHNVNAVQLMPIEDFASIDETDDAIKRNWGYDPKNYNVPEGSYSSDPYDGNTRITEFKMLVQALHDRGIAVIMDVVYNHTYVLEGSALNLTTPNYYYRKASAEDYINGSGLGNCLAAEKKMVSKYISESLKYWVDEYHIDGFRFDLMGCYDINTMKTFRSELDKLDRRILMYGEPWAGGDAGIPNAVSNTNLNQLDRVGAFNENFSDYLKGDHQRFSEKGFVSGDAGPDDKYEAEMYSAASGAASYFYGAKVDQFINYTDNHDNLTLFDKILAANGASGYVVGKDGTTSTGLNLYEKNKNAVNNPSNQVLSQMKLALAAALTSQGIPFTVAGTEFCRTKYGDANSYRTPDEVNAIDWERADKYSAVADYYAGLVSIRKAFKAFTDSKSDSITAVDGGCTAWKITNSASGQWKNVIVALNNNSSAKSISLSGSWTIIANDKKAGTKSLGTASGSLSVPAYSAVILVDSSSFGSYSQPDHTLATLIVEHYTRDSASGSYSKVNTETSVFKEGQNWRATKDHSILFDHNFDKVESTASGNATSGSVVAGSNITVKYYYTRYIKSGYLTVQFYDTNDGSRVKTPMKYRLRDGDEFSIPAVAVQGYQLDASRYPAGTVGNFDADDPVSFTYYYKALSNDFTRVHYYNSKGWFTVLCYAYDDNGNEALGPWPDQTKATAGMKKDDSMGAGWVVIDVPTNACRVMFHYDNKQVPGQGEQGFAVSGEAWIKDGIVSFNNTIVTSHIELSTGKQLSPDVVKEYTNVSSNRVYITSANKRLNREYITPANASGFYGAGVTNVVYLYKEEGAGPVVPGDGTLIGDADTDGEVSILDATTIQRELVGLYVESYNAVAANVDFDSEVSILDATAIQRWLVGLADEDSMIGIRTGSAEGKHSFEEFVEIYDDLNTELSKYSPRFYKDDPYYKAGSDALIAYRSLTLNPSATAKEIDDAYDACKAAFEGLANITPVDEPDPEEFTLYITNNKNWSSVFVYYWGPEGEIAWPGVAADYVTTNQYGESIYSITLDLNRYDSCIINNGTDQSVDINLRALGQNAIYLTEQDENLNYGYGQWTYGGGGSQGGDVITTGSKMYMIPSPSWKDGGARYAAYFFNDGSYTWVNMKYAGEDLYSVELPQGYNNIIFCALTGSSTENVWDNVLHQTADLSVIPDGTVTAVDK